MKALYIGAGYVGACSAAVMAKFGHEVVVYDTNREKISAFNTFDRDEVEKFLFEQDLGSLVAQNKKRMTFLEDYQAFTRHLDDADLLFICVPTPISENGEYDLSMFYAALRALMEALLKRNSGAQTKYLAVVVKSTVPIDIPEIASADMTQAGVKNFGIVSNPEFLVEGQAIKDSFSPDRVVIGAFKEEDFKIMRAYYQRFYYSPGVNYIEVNPREAAAGKLLSNYILLSRLVTTFNVVGRVSESLSEINFEMLRKIITSDRRLGGYGFYNSFYAGGSCLTKDTCALSHQLEKAGVDTEQIRKVLEGDGFQLDHFYDRVAKEAMFSVKDKKIAVLGLSFKRDTGDIRNSGAIMIIEKLMKDGAGQIKVYDPACMEQFKSWAGSDPVFSYCESEEEALANTDGCFILTDWPQFSTLDQLITKICPPPFVIADGRRMISHSYKKLQTARYDILAVGSPFLKGFIQH